MTFKMCSIGLKSGELGGLDINCNSLSYSSNHYHNLDFDKEHCPAGSVVFVIFIISLHVLVAEKPGLPSQEFKKLFAELENSLFN